MSKLETNTIDTVSGSTTLTLGGTNATTIAQDSATTVTGFKSTGIDDNASSTSMTIDSNGLVLVNGSTAEGTAKFQAHCGDQNVYCASIFSISNNSDYIEFLNDGGQRGSIRRVGATGVSYNTTSDYRLKENVVEIEDATTRLKQLKPKRFNFIEEADKTVDGFLAHEVQTVVPEAVHGEKDAVNEDGTPDYQGIDQSKLVPLLVKTIQELEARITELENA